MIGVMLAALPACLAARTAGEVAHFGMAYQDCTSTCSDAVACEVDGKSKFTEQVRAARAVPAFLARTHARTSPIQVAQGKAAALGQAGAKPSAPYNLAEWRSLRKGAGAECQPEHLGAKLDVTPSSTDYSPLESALPSDPPVQTAPAVAVANFASDLSNGWTLELWLKPAPISTGDNRDRVLAALVASDPENAQTAGLQSVCGDASLGDKARLSAAITHDAFLSPICSRKLTLGAFLFASLHRCPSC